MSKNGLQRAGEKMIEQNAEILELEMYLWNNLLNFTELWLMSVDAMFCFFFFPEYIVSSYQIYFPNGTTPSLPLSFDSLDEAGFVIRWTSGYFTQTGLVRGPEGLVQR